MELFKGYIKDEKDIIGNEDLNNYLSLKGYENIEENYPELWFNSSRVFQFILEKTIHSKIYNASKEEFKRIRENEKTYIENEIYNQAISVLENYNCLLITGEAGIGKTSLARHICSEYVKKGYKFVYAYDVNDIWDNYTDNAQIFFLDDFWGSIFKEQQDKTEEKKFHDIIETIGKSGNKKLILTSREYIIEKGFNEHPKIEDCLDGTKMILKLENYSDKYKAKIYLKHVQESDLDLENMNKLIDACETVIHHSMYNPRLIAEFIQRASREIKTQKDYECCEELMYYLDSPEKFIKDIFDEQTEVAKLLLVLLFLRKWGAEVNELKTHYYEYLQEDSQIGKKEDFSMAMKQLSNDLISIQEDETFKKYYEDEETKIEIPVIVEFLNPSIEDYIYRYFTRNLDKYFQNIINSTTSLNILMFLGVGYASQIKEVDGYKRQINKIQNMIIEKIIKDYDKLKYKYRRDVMDGELYPYQETELSELENIIRIYNNIPNNELKRFLENKVNNILNEILIQQRKLTYKDRIYLPAMLEALQATDINIKLEREKIIEIYYNSIEHAEEFRYMESLFKIVFPEEIEKFMNEHFQEIKAKLPKMVMKDANYYKKMGYNRELANLIDIDYPDILKRYNFKPSKRYESNLMYIANHLYRNWEWIPKGNSKLKMQQKEEVKSIIKEAKNKMINKFANS